MDIGDIRKQVRRTIDEARRAAAERRIQVAAAEQDGTRVLADVVAPLLGQLAAALRAEGHRYRVLTPSGAVRLAAESSADDYLEIAVDTRRNPPGLVGRTSRTWGRRVVVDETTLREAVDIAGLTAEDVLKFSLAQLAPLLGR